MAEDARAAENQRRDASWGAGKNGGGRARVDFLREGVDIVQVECKGRGLLTREAIPAGAIVLRERALAATSLDAPPDLADMLATAQPGDEAMLLTARLAAAVLVAGQETSTRALEPRVGREYHQHSVRPARADELARGGRLVRARCPQNAAFLDDDTLGRLLLAISINSHGITLSGGQSHQGLFPEVGAMVNHSCRPNLIHFGVGIEGEDGASDQLQLVLQAVRDIEPGEELTISYLDDLYLPFAERDERLRDLYGCPADGLQTDAGLQAVSALGASMPPAERAEVTQRVVAANSAAHEAWDAAAELRAASGEQASPQVRAELGRLEQTAASHYAALLNANLLAETHAWRFNATCRLASLLTRGNAPKSCAQALLLLESALRAGHLVWPSENWPEHRRLLRGACRAAQGAGDEARASKYEEEVCRIRERMSVAA